MERKPTKPPSSSATELDTAAPAEVLVAHADLNAGVLRQILGCAQEAGRADLTELLTLTLEKMREPQ